MSDIFQAAGLPKELGEFDEFNAIAREQTELIISTDSRRYGKLMTLVAGLDDPSIDAKRLLTTLKNKCACGGALKDGHIELQGDHVRKVKAVLEEMGFTVKS